MMGLPGCVSFYDPRAAMNMTAIKRDPYHSYHHSLKPESRLAAAVARVCQLFLAPQHIRRCRSPCGIRCAAAGRGAGRVIQPGQLPDWQAKFIDLWPTVLVRRQIAGHEQPNARLVDLIERMDRESEQLTTRYQGVDFLSIEDTAVTWLRGAIEETH